MTVVTPDKYGGAATTSKNLYRIVSDGTPITTWTEVAGAATFTSNPGDEVQIAFGIGASDDDDEPFGPYKEWTIPCQSYPKLTQEVIDDTAAGTSLSSTLYDPNDGNSISSTDPVDLDAGQVKSIKWVLSGVFEESYGNPWCWSGMGKGNVVTIKYNNTQIDSIALTDASGSELQAVTTPSLYASAAGFLTKSYQIAPIESTKEMTYFITVDTDDSINPDGGIANMTVYMYDVNMFQNNDVTPPAIRCGVEDEDAAQVGGSTDFSATIVVTDD